MEFSRDYLVHYYEADGADRLTLPSLVNYLEDIAILHSTAVGLDLAYYAEHQCGWMLLKWDVEITDLPSFGSTVRVMTRVHAMKGFLADREFFVYGSDGRELAKARSNWLLVDTVRRRPMRVPKEQYERFGVTEESQSSFISIDDAENAEGDGYVATERARHSDIDTNRHVNNVRYIEWALDSLPADFYSGKKPCALRAHYKRELTLGAEVEVRSRVGTTGSSFLTSHAIAAGEEDFCRLSIHWVKE